MFRVASCTTVWKIVFRNSCNATAVARDIPYPNTNPIGIIIPRWWLVMVAISTATVVGSDMVVASITCCIACWVVGMESTKCLNTNGTIMVIPLAPTINPMDSNTRCFNMVFSLCCCGSGCSLVGNVLLLLLLLVVGHKCCPNDFIIR